MSRLTDEELVSVSYDGATKAGYAVLEPAESTVADLKLKDEGALALVAALRAVADAAVAADRASRGEPVAYGMLNTSITGREKPLMMVRIDIPADDQYQGKLWVPLYLGTKDSIEENQQ